MKNYLEYKGYIGTAELSLGDRIFFGASHGINDSVTFEAQDFDGPEQAFHEAVDDYLDVCRRNGKDPEKAYKGQFNVRIAPELPREIAGFAARENMSLNQYVARALEKCAAEKKSEQPK